MAPWKAVRAAGFGVCMLVAAGVELADATITVSNVRVQQRPGTRLVDIYYDLEVPDQPAATDALALSTNLGLNYAPLPGSINGAVGASQARDFGKKMTWNPGLDWPGDPMAKLRFRVTAGHANVPADMAFIPAGTFNMGDAFAEGNGNELPVHAVYVSAFYIERYEVTNEKMVEVTQWALDHGRITASQTAVHSIGGGELLLNLGLDTTRITWTWDNPRFQIKAEKGVGYPCVGVSWHGAAAYCNYRSEMEGLTPCYNLNDWSCNWNADGYRLPTEAEWEKAARGGLNGLRFPWGNTISYTRANYASNYNPPDPYYPWEPEPLPACWHPFFSVGDFPYTSPVGSFPTNGYGLCDVIGNVREWCWDWETMYNYYSNSLPTDPRGPETGYLKAMRSATWTDDSFFQRVSARWMAPPDSVYGDGIDGLRTALSAARVSAGVSAVSPIITVDFRSNLTAVAVGQVMVEDAPLAGAMVRFKNTAWSATTSTNGRFAITNVPVGTGYILTLAADGCASRIISGINLAPGTNDLGAFSLTNASRPFRLLTLTPNVNPAVARLEEGGVAYRYYRLVAADGQTPVSSTNLTVKLAGGSAIAQAGDVRPGRNWIFPSFGPATCMISSCWPSGERARSGGRRGIACRFQKGRIRSSRACTRSSPSSLCRWHRRRL